MVSAGITHQRCLASAAVQQRQPFFRLLDRAAVIGFPVQQQRRCADLSADAYWRPPERFHGIDVGTHPNVIFRHGPAHVGGSEEADEVANGPSPYSSGKTVARGWWPVAHEAAITVPGNCQPIR